VLFADVTLPESPPEVTYLNPPKIKNITDIKPTTRESTFTTVVVTFWIVLLELLSLQVAVLAATLRVVPVHKFCPMFGGGNAPASAGLSTGNNSAATALTVIAIFDIVLFMF